MRTTSRVGRPLSGWRGVAPGRVQVALAETVLLVLVLLAFTRLHAAVGTDVAVATDNARALQSVERGLHLDIELATNRWLAGHEALITPAVLFYRLYYAVLLGVLLWIFLRHADFYRHVRRTFVAMAGLALTWLSVALGLVSKSVETASNLPMFLMILPFLGSGFVPTDSMPAAVRWFAEYQPFTPVMDTLRGLLLGTAIGSSAVLSVVWCTGLTLVGYVWARRLYDRDPTPRRLLARMGSS